MFILKGKLLCVNLQKKWRIFGGHFSCQILACDLAEPGFLNKAARLMIKKNVIVASDLAEPGVPE